MFSGMAEGSASPEAQQKYAFIRHGEAEHNVLFRKGQVASPGR